MAINCGHCKSTHADKHAVKACAMADWAARAARGKGTEARVLPAAAVEASRSFARRSILDVSGYEHEAGKCGRCAGTGQFITYVENGVPKGPGGICFRCAGKGRQVSCGPDKHVYRPGETACCDITRNASYDTWGIKVYM